MEEVLVSNKPAERPFRGFGSIPGETLAEFRERMYDLDPLEAMLYEMDVALQQAE